MGLRVRIARESELHLIDELHRESHMVALGSQVPMPNFPSVATFPTFCGLLVETVATGELVGVTGTNLPGPDARFGFEDVVTWPCPGLLVTDRSKLGEGFLVYIRASTRGSGLSWLLAFLSATACWDAGASHLAAENMDVSLRMAHATGYRDTGIVTTPYLGSPCHLMVGDVAVVMPRLWSKARATYESGEPQLDQPLRDQVERWRAAEPAADLAVEPAADHHGS